MGKIDAGAGPGGLEPISNQSLPTFTKQASRAGLAALWRAYCCAIDAGVSRWDFALEIDQLQADGSTISNLRWLVAKGYAKHGREISNYGDQHRSFEKSPGFTFDAETCLVLSSIRLVLIRNSWRTACASRRPSKCLKPIHHQWFIFY